MTILNFNFNQHKPIPTDLFNRVWEAEEQMGQEFWGSDIHVELENFLDMEVVEINRSGW